MHPKRLSIVGVGLLGGSLGLALRALSDAPYEVIGFGHRPATLQTALGIGAIDRAADDLQSAVADASIVVLCTPVGLFEQLLAQMAAHLKPGTIVTDVGSTKRSVVAAAKRLLPDGVRFLGSHPMAGSEKRGIEFARTDLFQGATCIVTPTPDTRADTLDAVESLWRNLGMRVVRLSPDEHDRLLADISHLPHALAAALIAMQEPDALALAGKGFLDTTRIAGGDGAMWRDILLDNRDNLHNSVARLREQLARLLTMLEENQAKELARWLDAAAARRQELLQQKLREVNPD